MPQSPGNRCITESGSGLGDGSHGLATPTGAAHSEITGNKNKEWGVTGNREKQGACNNISNITDRICSHQEERKLDRQKLNMCDKPSTEGGGCLSSNSESHVPVDLKQSISVHKLLSYEEMCELMKRCNKPMKTATSIVLEEFDVLVTDVVDSCCFWANVDDQVRCNIVVRF